MSTPNGDVRSENADLRAKLLAAEERIVKLTNQTGVWKLISSTMMGAFCAAFAGWLLFGIDAVKTVAGRSVPKMAEMVRQYRAGKVAS